MTAQIDVGTTSTYPDRVCFGCKRIEPTSASMHVIDEKWICDSCAKLAIASLTMPGIQAIIKRKYIHGHPDFIDITLSELELHDAKNHDYAAGGRPLGNFERVSQILSLYPNLKFTPVTVALIYLLKQLDAILYGLAQDIKHKVENLDSRFADVSVYTKLARCAWRDRQKEV